MIARLPGAEHLKHQYVARRVVATGVGMDFVNRAIATVAGQLSCARMLTYRVKTRVPAQPVDRHTYRPQPASCPWPGARLNQPTADRLKVLDGVFGVVELSWHDLAVPGVSQARTGRWEFMVRVEAIDPRVDRLSRYHTSRGGRRAGRRNHVGLRGEAAPPLCLGFRARGIATIIRGRVHGIHRGSVVLLKGNCQCGKIAYGEAGKPSQHDNSRQPAQYCIPTGHRGIRAQTPKIPTNYPRLQLAAPHRVTSDRCQDAGRQRSSIAANSWVVAALIRNDFQNLCNRWMRPRRQKFPKPRPGPLLISIAINGCLCIICPKTEIP
jgi:hypothetical protein